MARMTKERFEEIKSTLLLNGGLPFDIFADLFGEIEALWQERNANQETTSLDEEAIATIDECCTVAISERTYTDLAARMKIRDLLCALNQRLRAARRVPRFKSVRNEIDGSVALVFNGALTHEENKAFSDFVSDVIVRGERDAGGLKAIASALTPLKWQKEKPTEPCWCVTLLISEATGRVRNEHLYYPKDFPFEQEWDLHLPIPAPTEVVEEPKLDSLDESAFVGGFDANGGFSDRPENYDVPSDKLPAKTPQPIEVECVPVVAGNNTGTPPDSLKTKGSTAVNSIPQPAEVKLGLSAKGLLDGTELIETTYGPVTLAELIECIDRKRRNNG